MFRMLFPFEYIESVTDIDYKKLYKKNYKAIVFDIDNTLVHHGEDVTNKVEEMFNSIHEIGLKTFLLSDNSEERVRNFARNMNTSYIANASKPNVANYHKAVDMLSVKREEVLYIGDQIFKDILGANRAGIDNILVKYMHHSHDKKIGIRRRLEKIILWIYKLSKSYNNRLGDILMDNQSNVKKRKLFCELHPICYDISVKKRISQRHIRNILSTEKFAKDLKKEKLPCLVSSHSSDIIKRGRGIDPLSQENKKVNIIKACEKINGLVLRPNETFSFYGSIGKVSAKKGFKEGRILRNNKLIVGTGGGLCNLANTIHLLVLHSPLLVTEFSSHSDALAPDKGKRKPFSSGTSVFYNYIDYRFKNNTKQDVQLLAWCEDDILHAELRCQEVFPYTYKLKEENHHFKKEGSRYYRKSKIYKETIDMITGNRIEKELVLDNNSKVMFDYDLIPKDQIKE